MTILKPLQWQSDGPNVIQSGFYQISTEYKHFVAELEVQDPGRPDSPVSSDWPWMIISKCETLEDAKMACEKHRTKLIIDLLTPEARESLGV